MSTSPAGWQPDPRGRHEYRYWDGSKWTDHVSDKGVVSSDPVADETPAEQATTVKQAQPAAEATPAASASAEPVIDPRAAMTKATPVPEGARAEPTASPAASSSAPPPGASSSPSPAAASPAVSPSAEPSPGSGAGGSASAAAETAKAQAKEALSAKSPDLALLLSVIAPGSGHLYMGVEPAKRNIAFGLLGATLAAVVLAYFSFITFIIGFVIWAGAAFFAMNDLRGGVAGLEDASIPQQFVGILLLVGGAVLIISLFLPWYHIKASSGGLSRSDSFSGLTVLTIIDIILLIIGVAAIVAGLANMGIIGAADKLPPQFPMIVAIAGAVAFVLVVFRMFVDPVPDLGFGNVDVKVGRAPGILLAADAAIILVMANLSTLKALRK